MRCVADCVCNCQRHTSLSIGLYVSGLYISFFFVSLFFSFSYVFPFCSDMNWTFGYHHHKTYWALLLCFYFLCGIDAGTKKKKKKRKKIIMTTCLTDLNDILFETENSCDSQPCSQPNLQEKAPETVIKLCHSVLRIQLQCSVSFRL